MSKEKINSLSVGDHKLFLSSILLKLGKQISYKPPFKENSKQNLDKSMYGDDQNAHAFLNSANFSNVTVLTSDRSSNCFCFLKVLAVATKINYDPTVPPISCNDAPSFAPTCVLKLSAPKV